MFDSGLGIFSGTLSVEEFQEGMQETSEVTETREINNSEGVEYSEEDLERVEVASDIMENIFTDEVISNWENLSIEERAQYLNEYYTSLGEALGVNTQEIYVADLYEQCGPGVLGVSHGNGVIGVDVRMIADPSQLGELLNTVVHETRHQLQQDAIENPDAFPGISAETLEEWAYESTHYIDPTYDPEGYSDQAIETDARAFAEEVINDYLSDAPDDAFAMAKDAAEIPAYIVSDGEQAADLVESIAAEAESRLDDFASAEEIVEMPAAKADIGDVIGIEMEEKLNKNTFSYTPGQCARISTGTQNYCPFAGSGR